MTMSDRLIAQLHHSQGRNFQAAFAHLDAGAIHDAPARIAPTGDIEDRFARERIESGICWRDVHQSRFSRFSSYGGART
tara:strand:- start:35888 stop:36124 length:237 start_codon:yes stop_codon:yes gene_type:complete